MLIICTNCGKQVDDECLFCTNCGKMLEKESLGEAEGNKVELQKSKKDIAKPMRTRIIMVVSLCLIAIIAIVAVIVSVNRGNSGKIIGKVTPEKLSKVLEGKEFWTEPEMHCAETYWRDYYYQGWAYSVVFAADGKAREYEWDPYSKTFSSPRYGDGNYLEYNTGMTNSWSVEESYNRNWRIMDDLTLRFGNGYYEWSDELESEDSDDTWSYSDGVLRIGSDIYSENCLFEYQCEADHKYEVKDFLEGYDD